MSLTLVIPRAEKWFQQEYITEVFYKLCWGQLDKVNIIEHKHRNYNTIYIHFSSWNHHKSHARYTRDYLVRHSKDLKLYYSPGLYWIVRLANRPSVPKKEFVPFYEVV